MPLNRRDFLTAAASATAFGPARCTSATTIATPGDSQSRKDLLRLLIESDRQSLIERLVTRIRAGLDYPTLLGAVAEASAREIRPYPHVGFKYHAFMVLHAVHLTTRLGRAEDRWLPILWAADLFKASQAAEQRLGSWTMGTSPKRLPASSAKAEDALRLALDRWDPEAADAAVVGLTRTLPRDRIFELLFRYGARDFRAIGHKAITVANCHRLLHVVSPDHTEPMLRSLVLALLNHRGEPNPSSSDLVPDRPWRRNLLLLDQAQEAVLPRGTDVDDQVDGMLQILREGSDEDASRALLERLNLGVPQSDLWTAIFAASGDLMFKQSGIISVHANTTSNALHYGYRHTADPATRRLLLLQAASFLPLFRELLGDGGRKHGIDSLAATESDGAPSAVLEEIFSTISADRILAAGKTLGYLDSGGAVTPFTTLARRYVVERSVGYHDYKFAEAAFENAASMDRRWRNPYLAASVLYLNGSTDKHNETVTQARALLAGHKAEQGSDAHPAS